jgi:hypothetical protein
MSAPCTASAQEGQAVAQVEPPPARCLISEEQFCDWVAGALPGQRLEYHRGLLGRDRMPSAKELPEPDRLVLAAVAKRALQVAESGRVLLVQRRHGDGDYSYTAIKTRRRRTGIKAGIGVPGGRPCKR